MVNFKRLSDKAKDLVEKRGGTEALKADAEELKNIAKGQGSISDKARAAAEALKDPGKRAGETPGTPAPEATPAPDAQVPAPEPSPAPAEPEAPIAPTEGATPEPPPEPPTASADDTPPKSSGSAA